jgi:bla regulator protein blaR1
MIPKYLSAIWATIAPALGDHLWQSTLFAIAAGLLTLVLHKNHARTRYWLWLAASVKFLIPFSLLVGMGSHLAWSRGSAGTKAGFYFAMEEIGQPFTQPAMSVISGAAPSTVSPSLFHLLPTVLAVAWLCGFAVVVFVWCLRWRQVSAAMRESAPLRDGREVEALRRLERSGGVGKRIDMLLSRASLEPGVFGIARPVLVWPEGISERLGDAHLEAILAHELRHVRRRDNLAAAIHMVVEAIFWFHPLVWWLGARLVEERERACDEEVVELGNERQVYAESILKVCEFCVESPLACVSGITGADLKKRMVHIMTERVARKLDFSRKLLLSAAVFVAFALPIGLGMMNATQGRAEAQTETTDADASAYKSASVQPHQPASEGNEHVGIGFSAQGITARGATLQTVIGLAYGVQADLISGAPDWVSSEKYDIDVKLPDAADEGQKPAGGIGIERLRMTLQAVLADRFKLTLHRQTKDLSIYELVVAEGGPKLQEAKPVYTNPNGVNGPEGRLPQKGNMKMGPGELIDEGATLVPLVEQLSWQLGHTVVDKTGLTGNYDFSLRWTPGESEAGMNKLMGFRPASDSGASNDSAGPTLFTALQEQLGLKLVPQKEPMQILVIDHVEKPTGEQSDVSTPVHVPTEEMSGLVLKKVPPAYPEMARVAHIQGAVVLDATIGKGGEVENLRLISGHPILAPAALGAVKQWKYEPYLLNGEPVEVETQVEVNFTLLQ